MKMMGQILRELGDTVTVRPEVSEWNPKGWCTFRVHRLKPGMIGQHSFDRYILVLMSPADMIDHFNQEDTKNIDAIPFWTVLFHNDITTASMGGFLPNDQIAVDLYLGSGNPATGIDMLCQTLMPKSFLEQHGPDVVARWLLSNSVRCCCGQDSAPAAMLGTSGVVEKYVTDGSGMKRTE